jgi:DNA polymerase I-like protein with 3'-5' exonuclease and polymerase domains
MKVAIVEIARKLPNGADMVLTLHDEVAVECDTGQGETVTAVIQAGMLAACASVFPEMPAGEVEVKAGQSWADIK